MVSSHNFRRVALVTCIVALSGVLVPAWNYFAMALRHPNWQIILLILFAPIMPLFYFALYRNQATLPFQKDLRILAFGAALALGILIGTGLPDWIALFERTSVLPEARHTLEDQRFLASAGSFLGSRQPGDVGHVVAPGI